MSEWRCTHEVHDCVTLSKSLSSGMVRTVEVTPDRIMKGMDALRALAGLDPEGVAGLVEAAKAAFMELNTIRARDGVPYERGGFKSSVDEDYFGEVVDNLSAALAKLEGGE